MKNYNIEGGINFFEELYKSLDDENVNIVDDSNLCLISNKPLIDKFVELKCGHKFNYVELYKDLVNHICKFNSMEGFTSRLNTNEIRCPYCRSKQAGVLPYYEELGLKEVPGVNALMVVRTNTSSSFSKCEYLTSNPNFDISGNNPIEQANSNTGLNCKFYKCMHYGSQIGIHQHTQVENYGDTKYYCWTHKKLVIKKYKQEKALKIKLEAKKVKEEIKLKAKEVKEEEKKKQKEEKEKMKEELKKSVMEAKANKKSKKNEDENVIIGTIDVLNENIINSNENNKINICKELLKSGINKGKECGCKIFSDNLCKRHYNLKNSNEI